MKKYLLSFQRHDGAVEVVYHDGIIRSVTFGIKDISIKGYEWFLTSIPVQESRLADMVAVTPMITIVDEDYHVTLDDFKHEYPYARNMHLLPDIWQRMSRTDQVLAWQGAKEYRQYTLRQKQKGFDYTPKIAASWLKEKQWLNDWKKL